ncbi:hypothetical protein E2C01_012554 [Portunus trituberculatus]|uniref:Uncharacterized protein n=1 Tax=Portunus trituberculatus TaxID=210409 RepID=A0A5B7DE18_PORTR|nr:hypothetical protein [Portunus trituberculatus]
MSRGGKKALLPIGHPSSHMPTTGQSTHQPCTTLSKDTQARSTQDKNTKDHPVLTSTRELGGVHESNASCTAKTAPGESQRWLQHTTPSHSHNTHREMLVNCTAIKVDEGERCKIQ